jgi:hypothetical protein
VRLAAHQPDLLPYTGFWHRVVFCDVFDLAIHDQFNRRGYTHRVKMHGRWLTLPVVKVPLGTPISKVWLQKGARDVLLDRVREEYEGSPGWDRYGYRFVDEVANRLSVVEMPLWSFNVELLMILRELLQIQTPFGIGRPLVWSGWPALLELCGQYAASSYVSGQGAKAYMPDDGPQQFEDADVELLWSRHDPVHGDSVLTTLFETEPVHPMAEILRVDVSVVQSEITGGPKYLAGLQPGDPGQATDVGKLRVAPSHRLPMPEPSEAMEAVSAEINDLVYQQMRERAAAVDSHTDQIGEAEVTAEHPGRPLSPYGSPARADEDERPSRKFTRAAGYNPDDDVSYLGRGG